MSHKHAHTNLSNSNLYCALPRRLLIVFYDAVILFGLLIVASALALPFGDVEKVALRDFWFTAWLLLVSFAYLGGCWHFVGMTVGMRAWKVRLVGSDGGNVSWPRCIIRFLTAMISWAALGLGFIWTLIDQQKRGWHDLAAGTVLVKTDVNNQLD